jgi:hypothetical protein
LVTHKPGRLHITYIKDSLQPSPPYRQPKILIVETRLRPGILGITKQITEQEYLIQISPYQTQKEWDITLLHELVHVKQFMRERLKSREGKWYWEAKPIDWNKPYRTRPWEQQAFKESEQYWQLYHECSQ